MDFADGDGSLFMVQSPVLASVEFSLQGSERNGEKVISPVYRKYSAASKLQSPISSRTNGYDKVINARCSSYIAYNRDPAHSQEIITSAVIRVNQCGKSAKKNGKAYHRFEPRLSQPTTDTTMRCWE